MGTVYYSDQKNIKINENYFILFKVGILYLYFSFTHFSVSYSLLHEVTPEMLLNSVLNFCSGFKLVNKINNAQHLMAYYFTL